MHTCFAAKPHSLNWNVYQNSNDFSILSIMSPNPLADLGAGLTTKSSSVIPHPGGPIQHGTTGQIERAFTAASTFFSGMLA
jgi:hypothetical protein